MGRLIGCGGVVPWQRINNNIPTHGVEAFVGVGQGHVGVQVLHPSLRQPCIGAELLLPCHGHACARTWAWA